ncbi:hypothetical protein FHG87_015777, partial [Trinorchestia longiramus]
MVCIPCFLIPAALFIWYRFLQPLLLKIWNPFGHVEDNAASPNADGKTE